MQILLGYDEGYLSFSGIAAAVCRLLRQQPPCWRRAKRLNRLALKAGLRFAVRPKDLAANIEDVLQRQRPV